MNYTYCQQSALPDPPTDSPNCAMYADFGQAAILKSCCRNGPIANYSGDAYPTYCFQYCNITDPGLTSDDVKQCILDQLAHTPSNLSYSTTFDCGTGKNATTAPSRSSASRPELRNLGWIFLVITITIAILGADVAV
jgi:hypothetical protein